MPLTQADVRRKARVALILRARTPRDGDGDGFYSPWKGAPDKTPVPFGGVDSALARWQKDYARSGDSLGSSRIKLVDVDDLREPKLGESYNIDDPEGLLDDLGEAERRRVGDAMFVYATSTTSQWVNRHLRNGTADSTMMERYVRPLDVALAASRLESPIVVHRGVHDLPPGWDREDLTGAVWVERSFVSTSADEREAADFATQGRRLDPDDEQWGRSIVMTLVVPEGTGAIGMSEMHSGQAEVLLQRGLRMRVVRDNGVNDYHGTRALDVEVVPLSALPTSELVALLRAEGLPTDGDREALLARLYGTATR